MKEENMDTYKDVYEKVDEVVEHILEDEKLFLVLWTVLLT